MCDYITPIVVLILMGPMFVFGIIVIICSVFTWTKSFGFQSIKALGIGTVTFCTLIGIAYGVITNADVNLQEVARKSIVGFVCAYPFLYLAKQHWKTSKDYSIVIWLPAALITAFLSWQFADLFLCLFKILL